MNIAIEKIKLSRHPSFGVKEPKDMSTKQIEYLEAFFRNIIRIEIEKYINENKKEQQTKNT